MAMTDQPVIRNARAPDAQPLRQLIWNVMNFSYVDKYPPRAIRFFQQFHSQKNIVERCKAGTVLVVEETGKLVATGSLLGGEIFAVFVSPDMQGRGLGQAVMSALEREAKAQGIDVVELSISLPSKNFYLRLGYKIFESRSRDVGEGQTLDSWQARKILD